MNKYSEWIFQYLEKRTCVSTMWTEFQRAFGIHGFKVSDLTRYTVLTPKPLLMQHDNKLCFFWLLAHVDQETADELLNEIFFM